MRHTLLRAALLLTLAAPGAAPAAGYLFPDNGAGAMARGGAFAALPTDASAVYYNPAGLSDLDGTRLLLSGQLSILSSRFQRMEQLSEGEFADVGQPVSNSANPWVVPFFAASHRLPFGLTLGIGGFGPSAFGTSEYPDPRDIAPFFFDGVYEEDEELDPDVQAIAERAPQRYNLLREFIVVAYPSVALSWAPTDWLSIGGTAQVAVARVEFAEAIQAAAILGDGPENDLVAELDVWSDPVLTGVLGVQVRPLKHLVLGASVRPGFTLVADGDLDITLTDYLGNLGYVAGEGSTAVFTFDFPTIVRLGAAWEQAGWLAEFDAVYEGWSAVEEFLIEPDVQVEGPFPVDIERISIPKQWQDAWSFRLGGRVDLQRAFGASLPLQLSAGYLHETSAIPDRAMSLEFIAATRDQLTAGVTWPFGDFAVTAAFGHIFQPQVQVRDSIVPKTVAIPDQEPQTVGNGNYDASYTLFMVGLEARFGAEG